ncbi:MAG: tetratricopeptide repeat protein, partial [Acidobacteria bacterium]|nr:tetratricopeptide repeat protein [Acidobacteriota bacterium]
LTARWTENAEVYRLYLKARFYLPRNDPESLQKAISFFQQTIALAPEAAPAHAGLAEACIVGSYFFAPQEMMRQARSAAAKAIELDSQSFEAHVSLGAVKSLYDWEWQEAEREFKRAVQLNPNYAPMYRWYGMFLTSQRRFDEAFAVFERALELDPLSLPLNAYFGLACLCAGEPDRAIEQCHKTLELDARFLPALGFLGMSYLEKGDFARAVATFEKQCETQRASFPLANLAHAYAVAGRENEARKILAELNRMSQKQSVLPLFLALVYAGLDEKEKLYDCLKKALDERNVLLPSYLNTDPRFQGLRSETRFQELLRRVGLTT